MTKLNELHDAQQKAAIQKIAQKRGMSEGDVANLYTGRGDPQKCLEVSSEVTKECMNTAREWSEKK